MHEAVAPVNQWARRIPRRSEENIGNASIPLPQIKGLVRLRGEDCRHGKGSIVSA